MAFRVRRGDSRASLRSPSLSRSYRRTLFFETCEARIVLNADPVALLRDIETKTPGSNPSEFVEAGGKLYFAAGDALIGQELYVTDGIGAPKLVKDIWPGIESSDPEDLISINGQLFFTADDGIHGRELWTSDGTAAGTRLVQDLEPGPESSVAFEFTAAGEFLFFTAETSAHGLELWLATSSGAQVVELNPGPDGSTPTDLVFYPQHLSHTDPPTLIPASVMLAATSPTAGHELWRVDVAGNTSLVKNIYHERTGDDPNSSNPGDLTLFNELIYFRALDGEYNDENEIESHGVELWVSDGTSAGTRLFAELASQLIASPNGLISASSSPSGFTRFNGKLYFAASDPSNGRELWRTDGTIEGTELFRNLRSGSASSSPDSFTVVTDDLFFVADNGTGRELFRTDGTAANTGIVRDIRAGALSSNPQQLFAFGNQLLFTADDETNVGRELWISDGAFAGTQVIKNIAPGRVDSNPHDFVLLNGVVYFSAFNFEHESEVWRTDGSEAGTQVFDVPTITTQGSEPTELVRWGTKLAFVKDDGSLWVSDGSTAGTAPLAGLTANELLPVDDKLYFVRSQDELWVTNAQGQTTLLKDFTGDQSGFPQELTRFGDQVALVARTAAGGQQLWISNGTPEGTIPLGPVDGGPRFLTVVGNTLYFTAIGPEDLELWKSDGTAEGTMIVKDIVPDGASFPSNLFSLGDLLYFVASDAEHGDELWLTDGSEEGTRLVADVQAGPDGSSPLPLGALGSTLLFFANDGASGQELWKTDGTLEGTTLVLDIQRGPESSPCDDELDGNTTVVFEGEVYFIARDGTHGCELWSTDGTTGGTFLVSDVAQGPLDAKPSWLTVVGDQLFFSADTYLLSSQTFAGRELFSTDGSTDGTALYSFINTVDNSGSEPTRLTEVSGRLYLVANDVIHGPEIWTTTLRLSLDDLVFEILAKDMAYRDWNLEDNISLEAYNLPHVFTVDYARQDATTGFDAFGLIAENIDPVLIVRGSVDFLTDWFSDFDPRGVGVSQFLPNIAGVRAWMDGIAATQAPVSITGHSLGGALTQLIAADYTSLGNRLGQVVTFNAPAILQDYADQFIPQYVDRVMHHITNGDPVSMAGDAFLPGMWRRYDFSDLNLANNHVLPVLNERVFVDKPDPEPDLVRLRPEDLTFEDYATTEWLSSPFYFHTDLDYFFWLAVGQQVADAVLPQPAAFIVPKALLFRSTAELGRQLIGGFWHTLNDAVQQTIATVTCQSPEARVELPDIELNLVELLHIRATGLAIGCTSGPDPVLRIQGEVTLPNVYNVTANFAGGNFIQLSDEGFDLVGTLSAESIPIVPGAFSVNSAMLGVNTLAGTLEAAGQLEIARWGITIDAALGFVGGTQFNFVEVDINGINRPLGFILPGAFLQRIAGRLNHVAEADPLPTSFGGGIGMTLGPQITVNLPSWAGGTYNAKLLTLDVNGDFDRNHLTAAGEIEIVEGLATANGNLELNWDEGFVAAAGNFNLLQGLIQAENASFRADTALNVNLQAAATFSVPDPIPLIGGTQGLSGNVFFEYINDESFANDSAAAWTVFNLPVIGPRTLGFRVWLDGSFSLLGASEVEALPNQAEGETQSAASYAIAADTPWAIFSASWEIPNAAEFIITMPDGTVLSEADIAARDDMALVTDFHTSTRRVLVVNQPAAGEWIVNIAGEADLGGIGFFTGVPSAAQQLSIDSVSGGALRSNVEFAYSAGDDDSAAAVTFYYDTDASGNDGVRIGGVIESDASGEFTWSTAAVLPGTYYVYAVIDDGVNAPQVIYAAETITVTTSGVEGLLWYDLNANGLRDDGEIAAGGTPVFVDLNLDGDWNANEPLSSADDAGVYRIFDLAAGDYQLRVLPKSGFVPSEPATGVVDLTLSAGEFVSGRDFGLRQIPASISGVVWRDQDRDGFRDASEAPLPNVSVSLINLFGETVGNTTTNNDGQYVFASLVPGEYRVHFTPPVGHVATPRFVPGKDDFDSDITPGAASSLLSLVANEHFTSVDAGFFHPSQSPRHPLDVDGDGFIAPLDALLVINYLNAVGSSTPTSAPPYLDVDANNVIAPLDALLIINFLNAGGVGDSGEGEAANTAKVQPTPSVSGADWYFYHYGSKRGRSEEHQS